MKEEWKKINGFPDYEISNYGKVKSYKNMKPIVLKPALSMNYSYVTLRKNKKQYHHNIHTLVLEHFKCKRPKGKSCAHIDGNKLNNRIDNLKWVNHSYCIIKAVKEGKKVLNKEEIIKHFYENKIVRSNNLYNIKYRYGLKKTNDTKEKIKHRIIIDTVIKYNCSLTKAAKLFNVSREWIRQVITKNGYIKIKYLFIDGEMCGQKIMAGKGKVRK